MGINITVQSVRDFFSRIKATYPEDYTYEQPDTGCSYVEGHGLFFSDLADIEDKSTVDLTDATPSCIDGHYLHEMGVPLHVLLDYEDLPFDLAAVRMQEAGVIDRMDGLAADYLTIAQQKQDRNIPWHRAIDIALNEEN